MNSVVIKWQRLVDNDGQTCERCACTGNAVDAAFGKLSRSLAEVGITVILQKHAISRSAFDKDPLLSNQILIDGRTLEEWLGAGLGNSPCCGACGDNECRTVMLGDKIYEEIPESLILRAGLLAAVEKLK